MKQFNYKKFVPSARTGARLFLMALALVLTKNLVVAAIVGMFFPIAMWAYNGFKYGVFATGLTDEQKEEAILSKIEKKYETMIEKALKGLINEKEMEKVVADLNKNIVKLSSEGIESLKKTIDELNKASKEQAEALEAAQKALLAQSTELKKIQDKGVEDASKSEGKSFRSIMEAAIKDMAAKNPGILEEVTDTYGKRFSFMGFFNKAGRNASTPVMTMKVATDMFESNIVQSNVAALRLTQLDPNRVSIPLSLYPHVTEVFMVKGIQRPYMALMVVYSYEDGVATKVEGAASGKSSFLLTTVSFPAFYDATHFVLSDETLEDLDEVLDEISLVAPDKLRDAQDAKVLGTAGDDVAGSGSLKGIRTTGATGKSTAYATVFGAASIDDAYIVDVISDMKMQCEANKYRPTVVILNPVDIAKLGAKKDAVENSQKDNRVVYGPTGEASYVCGLLVVKQTNMPVNQCIVADNSLPWIGSRREMTMEIGYNGTDLTEGQKTLTIKQRYAFGVRDKAGIIWCADIDAAIAGITK
jgi:hypothetical protein